ncbi:MAG: hypothetical protein HXL34_08025, partial [Prevotellaceae bacterium]|nr:hypothetical protein [Prevotellaceae bacterium]
QRYCYVLAAAQGCNAHRSAAADSAADGRHTMCSTIAVRAAGDRRTMGNML